MRQPLKLTLLCAGAAAIVAAARVQLTQTEVFRSGEGGYHTYRIPALITSRKGTLLAFCEGRRQSRGDSGDIDLLLKRSFDQGKTWTKTQVIADFDKHVTAQDHFLADARSDRKLCCIHAPEHIERD